MAGNETTLDAEKWDNPLPTRLFATDRYPVARLSIYSKPDILSFIHDKLKGTQEFDTIRQSCFGRLFDIPVMRCPVSGRLIHALICRQLLTKKKYEFWTVFGGQPLRFSLVEFGLITGLPCGEFPKSQTAQSRSRGKDSFWKELIGDDPNVTLSDLADMLEKSPDMPRGRRLGLALILIVDGVLMSNTVTKQKKPTMKYVEMLKDVDSFLRFPWGRESFLCTVRSLRPGTRIPGKRGDDPVEKLRLKLQQKTMAIQGFPLVLQLLAYRAIPRLLTKIPVSADERSFMEWPSVGLPKKRALLLKDVLEVEHDPNLDVAPIMQPPEEDWAKWEDEVEDGKVAFMVNLISTGHVFNKSDWPGGDLLTFPVRKGTSLLVSQSRCQTSKARARSRSKNKKGFLSRNKSTKTKAGSFKTNQRSIENIYEILSDSGEELSQPQDELEEFHEVTTNPLKRIKLNDGGSGSSDLHKEPLADLVDVNGFLVLPSQVERVKRIFERHPDIALGVPTESQFKTSYTSILLDLIRTLCRSPQELSDADLKEASTAVSLTVNSGFKLDWLVEKLNQVLEKKNKVQSGESRLPEMKEELLKLDKKRSDLKASLEKEKAKIEAAKKPFSFDDIV